MPFDPFVVGSAVSGALGAAGNVIGGLFGARNQDKANAANVRMQNETNQLNRYLAEHQFSLAADDLERAGLSKNLAAGTPMSLPAINAAKQESIGDFGVGAAADGVARGVQTMAELARAQADISKTRAEIEFIQSQRDSVDLKNVEQMFVNSVLEPRYTMEVGRYDSDIAEALSRRTRMEWQSTYEASRMPFETDLMAGQALNAYADVTLKQLEADYERRYKTKMPVGHQIKALADGTTGAFVDAVTGIKNARDNVLNKGKALFEAFKRRFEESNSVKTDKPAKGYFYQKGKDWAEKRSKR